MRRSPFRLTRPLALAAVLSGCINLPAFSAQHPRRHQRKQPVSRNQSVSQGQETQTSGPSSESKVIGQRIRFADGSSLDVDDVWKVGDEFWYRLGGLSRQVDRPVRSIERVR